MSVYVDPLKDWGWRLGPSCHMSADTDEELHEMADRIGMKRSWAQDMDHPRQHFHHYDLVASRRKRAVALGAIEVSWREWSELALLGEPAGKDESPTGIGGATCESRTILEPTEPDYEALIGEVGLRLLRRVNRGETLTPERAVTEMLNVFDAALKDKTPMPTGGRE